MKVTLCFNSGHSGGCCRGLAPEPREDGREGRGPE